MQRLRSQVLNFLKWFRRGNPAKPLSPTSLGQLGQLAQPAPWELLVRPEAWEQQALSALQDPRVSLVLLERRDSSVLLVRWELRELSGLRGAQVLLDRAVLWEAQAQPELLARMVQLVRRGLSAKLGRPELRDPPARIQPSPALRAQQDRLELLALPVPTQPSPALRARLGLLE